MASVDLSPPVAKQTKLASAHEINDLSDAELSEIFKHLPPFYRLLISEVCRRWLAIARKAWTDVTRLDFSPIPGPNLATVIKLCPNLRRVTASRKTFDWRELWILSRLNLTSLKLFDCEAMTYESGYVSSALLEIFSDKLLSACWDELVLHELVLVLPPTWMRHCFQVEFLSYFPPTLKRLQISGVKISDESDCSYADWPSLSDGILQLDHLECLMLHSNMNRGFLLRQAKLDAGTLQNLRELYLSSLHLDRKAVDLFMSLAKLEVLFLYYVCIPDTQLDVFDRLATKHPKLRILALTGPFKAELLASPPPEVEWPARLLFGNGFSADPLPQLHIFVGKSASERIRFPTFHSDAVKVYPISEPLPHFLTRVDVAPIFEGVWIAEKIKEAAKQGSRLYKYGLDIATSLRSVDA